MIGKCSSAKKSMKCTTKVTFHFIEETVLNSFILLDKVIGTKRFLQFKLLLIRQMLGDVTRERNFQSLPNADRQFLELVPANDKKEKPQKRCVVCTKEKKRKENRYQCKTCSNYPWLCTAPCFEVFHTEVFLSKLAYIKRVAAAFKTLFTEIFLRTS